MSPKPSKKARPQLQIPAWQNLPAHARVLFDRLIYLKEKNVLPQVILFEGQAGLAKRSLAAALSAAFFCEKGRGCGVCPSCQRLASGREEDLLWLSTEETSFKLESAHQVIEHLSFKPWTGTPGKSPTRLVVLVEIEKLNDQAANCLLKTLEEPPSHARMILTTSRIKSILPTILSRCVKFSLKTNASIEDLSLQPSSPEEDKLWRSLLQAAGDPLEVVKIAETLIKNYGYSAAELAVRAEAYLNEFYRKNLSSAPLPIAVMRKRRESLSQIRRLALHRKITLNAQLSAEGIGGI